METDQGPEDFLAVAKATLERIKSLIAQVGLKYVELPEVPVGVGIAIAFGETQYVVLSIMGGSEGQLNITSGILRDIQQDRVTAVSLCNGMVRDNPAYPIYLLMRRWVGTSWSRTFFPFECFSSPRASLPIRSVLCR